MTLLSILIPTLESRKPKLNVLMEILSKQLHLEGFKLRSSLATASGTSSADIYGRDNLQVEILTLCDNKEKTTGAKRNDLLSYSKGLYICFIDDDDQPYPAYMGSIIKGCLSGVDCISIRGLITTDGKSPIRWLISKDLKDETVTRFGRKFYNRHTNHLAPVKRSIALRAGFPDKSNAEDSEYSRRLKESGLLQSEYKIDFLLYHYKYSSKNKEYK